MSGNRWMLFPVSAALLVACLGAPAGCNFYRYPLSAHQGYWRSRVPAKDYPIAVYGATSSASGTWRNGTLPDVAEELIPTPAPE